MRTLLLLLTLLLGLCSSAQVIDNSSKIEDKLVREYKFKKFVSGIFKYSTVYTSFTEN